MEGKGARGEEGGDVLDAPGEGGGAPGPLRVIAQVVGVVLEHGAAAGGVDDDRSCSIVTIPLEGGDGALGQLLGGGEIAAVGVECAAAALVVDVEHVAA